MRETQHNEPATKTVESGTAGQQAMVAPATGMRSRIGIVLSLLVLYLIWGSTYLAIRISLQSIPPFITGGARFVTAGIILYVFLRLRGSPAPTRKQWLSAALIGPLMLVGSNGMVSFAEQWVATGVTAVAMAAVPLWTALFAGLLGRWPTRFEWVGLALGFAGVILLNLENGLWAAPQGAIALLIAPLCWAIGSALSARVTLASGFMASASQMILGGLAQLLVAALLGERVTRIPEVGSLLALLYLILFGSVLAFTAYGYLLRRVRPALATSYAYVNPVVALMLGIWLASEKITIITVLAMFVILTGVGLVSLRKNHV
jgi:drug/metabolite transporter (DMT)-like permease